MGHTSHYRFEISQNSLKSTVRGEIDQSLDAKLGAGGKFFSSFPNNQNCSEALVLGQRYLMKLYSKITIC